MPPKAPRSKKGNVLGVPFLFVLGLALSLCLPSHANELSSWQAQARQQQLASQPGWQALLHLRGKHSLIEDPQFILSHADFSVERELERTLALFFSGSAEARAAALCRYPARYVWLTRALQKPDAQDPVARCPAIAEFFDKAPAQRIDLIYASENLSSPSSMMGHVLLKLSGTTTSGSEASHAVSYFTQIGGINLPRILFESLVTGKPGYYTLSPYREKEDFYRLREQRNVWMYPLQLDEAQRKLLRLHLWELKDARLSYYFHRYNCATLTRFLLAIADPALLKDQGMWTTPLDAVRALQSSRLLGVVETLPSDRWLVEALSQQLPPDLVREVNAAVRNGEAWAPSPRFALRERYLGTELARALAAYLGARGLPASAAAQQAEQASIQALQRDFAEERLDLSQCKSPLRRPQDSQWRAGVLRSTGENLVQLGFLPTSHRLEDSNRQSFSESALQLGDITLTLNPQNGQLELQDFQLYAMTSLSPANTLTGGWSGRVRLGVEQHRDAGLKTQLAANASGAIGLTARLSNDVFIYALLGAGTGYAEGGAYVYGEPELGIMVNEVWQMKSLLRARTLIHQLGADTPVHELAWTQTKALDDRTLLVADYAHTSGALRRTQRWGLYLKRYF